MVSRLSRSAAVGASLAGVALALASHASAQESLPVTTPGSSDGRVVYDQAFFARFEPNTAEDLLRRIPGVAAILDGAANNQQDRGFGSGGPQVLLDGRRFPGKANEITTTLRRIPAGNVARVELVSGASSDINIQSQGIVVNIVLRPGASIGGAGSWELNGRFSDHGRRDVDGLFAYSGVTGALSYGLGVERNAWSPQARQQGRFSYRTRDEIYWRPDGSVEEIRPQTWRRTHDKWIFTDRLGYDFAGGDRLTLNGLYEWREVVETALTPLRRFGPTGAETLRALELQSRNVHGAKVLEVGGEYISSFGPGDFTGLFIVRRTEEPELFLRDIDLSTRVAQLSRSEGLLHTGEDIVRGSYVLPLAAGRTLELGAEGARNNLDRELLFFRDLNGDAILEEVKIDGVASVPRVKELRGEVFGVLKWQAVEAVSLEGTLAYEYSRLTSNYPSQPARELGFLKPRIDARFRPTSQDQIRVMVERTVSQLDFLNFVPRYNVDDQVVESGNPGLEPEKVWTYEVGYERRLPRDGGLIELRAYYDDITDAIDRFPFCRVAGALQPLTRCLSTAPPAGSRLDSAFGNIAQATRYGAEAKVSLRLGFVGLSDAVLSLGGERKWSRVKDPFTGQKRRLLDDERFGYKIGFRHDLTAWRASYGFDYKSVGVATINSDLSFTEFNEIDPMLEAFAERRLFGGLTLRLELQNLTHSHERRSRYLYNVAAAGGQIGRALRRVEFFEERRDIRGAIRLRGRY